MPAKQRTESKEALRSDYIGTSGDKMWWWFFHLILCGTIVRFFDVAYMRGYKAYKMMENLYVARGDKTC